MTPGKRGMMNHHLLPMTVRLHSGWHSCRRRLVEAWDDRRDDTGLDEAVTKMIWLAVGIVVALAATAFFMATFNQAKDSVPDPVAP